MTDPLPVLPDIPETAAEARQTSRRLERQAAELEEAMNKVSLSDLRLELTQERMTPLAAKCVLSPDELRALLTIAEAASAIREQMDDQDKVVGDTWTGVPHIALCDLRSALEGVEP